MSQDLPSSRRLQDALERLTVHDHVCLIYETQEQQFASSIPFMVIGLERGEQCTYIADDNTTSVVLEGMQGQGIDVATHLREGRLKVITKRDSYVKQGCFDPDWMIEFLKETCRAAQSGGFSGLRVTGEMTWALAGDPGSDRLLEYEAKLNKFFPDNHVLAICQYDSRRFSPEVILDVIRTHPLVIQGGAVCQNVFYIPPEEFLENPSPKRVAECLLNTLVDRERREQALREQIRLNQILLDGLPPVAMLLRPRTREIVACNKAGKEVGAFPGETCFNSWGKSDSPCPWCLAPKLWKTGEAQHIRTEGVGRVWDAHWVPVADDLYLHYAYDITDAQRDAEAAHTAHERTKGMNIELAQRAEELNTARQEALDLAESLEQALATADAANTAKSEFLANMSHEIRTPMTAILGFAEVLSEECQKKCAFGQSQFSKHINTIKHNGQHLQQIIGDILDLSKIEAGKIAIERIACSPCRVVADVVSLGQVNAKDKGVSFEFEFVGKIPETISTDPTRLRQILINLTSNSIRFTEQGSIRLIARYTDGGQGSLMQFDVEDTGIGMAKEQVSQLFEPFTQADASMTRKFGGTGLGIAISKQLARLLGGDIVLVDTQKGVGSHFRVTVSTGPLEGVNWLEGTLCAAAAKSDMIENAPDADALPLDAYRVLVAEDGPDNQRLILHILKKLGAEVECVENGKLAVTTAMAAWSRKRECDPTRPFDIILMDMQMPVMDGYEATNLLRQKGYTGPIIALTAHVMSGDRERCLQAGCDDYAAKPIERKKLVETINKLLNKNAARCPKGHAPPATASP